MSYKVFITKSKEAACLICHGLELQPGDSRDYGIVDENSIIPSMYFNYGTMYYCLHEYKSNDGVEEYKLIVC